MLGSGGREDAMDTLLAIREMGARSGVTLADASRSMGRDRTYLNAALSRGSVPRADTLAEICDAMGYELQAVPKGGGEPIRIEAGQRG